jgi:hypothetical protein
MWRERGISTRCSWHLVLMEVLAPAFFFPFSLFLLLFSFHFPLFSLLISQQSQTIRLISHLISSRFRANLQVSQHKSQQIHIHCLAKITFAIHYLTRNTHFTKSRKNEVHLKNNRTKLISYLPPCRTTAPGRLPGPTRGREAASHRAADKRPRHGPACGREAAVALRHQATSCRWPLGRYLEAPCSRPDGSACVAASAPVSPGGDLPWIEKLREM